jgi:hypothetical protein
MNGSEFTDLVIEHVGSELTRAKAYSAINNAQNYLLGSRNLGMMRVTPDPFLTTVAGTFQYAASSSLFSSVGGIKGATQYDIRAVTRIFAFNNDQRIFAYNSQDVVSDRPYEEENSSSEVRAIQDVIQSIKPLAADCSIVWWEDQDPGDTTIDWRAECYRWPAQFTAETVELEVPEGWQDTMLLWQVLRRLGIKQYGGSSQSLDILIRDETPRFLKACGGGIRSRARRTRPSEV